MKHILGTVTAKVMPVLIAGAVLAALVALSFLKYSEMYAQTESSEDFIPDTDGGGRGRRDRSELDRGHRCRALRNKGLYC